MHRLVVVLLAVLLFGGSVHGKFQGGVMRKVVAPCTNCCIGLQACSDGPDIVDNNSCNGVGACRVTDGPIGEGSCNAVGACAYSEKAIGDGSCNGESACQNRLRKVGDRSCNGDKACLTLSYVDVGNDSCNGDGACKCDNPKGHRNVYQVGNGECNRKGDDFSGTPTCCNGLVWQCDCEETSSGGLVVGNKTCANINRNFTGGTLGCNILTCEFDTSGCTTSPTVTLPPVAPPTTSPPVVLPNGNGICFGPICFNGCFSANSLVETSGGHTIAMRNLKAGEQIKVADGVYEQVYIFGHHSEDTFTDFLRIHPFGLEVTDDHMVYVDGKGNIPAGLISVGDSIDSTLVTHIDHNVTLMGVYAPFTPSGTLVVNGVKVSNYVAFQSSSHLFEINNVPTPFTHQWLAHTSQFPTRLVCHYIMKCNQIEYTDKGLPVWIDWQLRVVHCILSQNSFIKTCFIAVLGTIFAILASLEFILMQWSAFLGLLLIWVYSKYRVNGSGIKN